MTFGTSWACFMAQNDFKLAAERAEAAAYSALGWPMGQRGRAAAIHLELRQIDARTVEQLAREIETASAMFAKGKNVSRGNRCSGRKRRVLVIWETPARAQSC
jgi:hypothetical protein